MTVTARAYDLGGKQLGSTRRATVSVPSSATAEAFTAAFASSLPDFHLLRLSLQDGRGRLLSQNTYWRYRRASDMKALNKARTVRVSADIGQVTRAGSRRTATARIHNRGSAVAAMVRLSLLDSRTDARVLPTLYSDNYVWLLPDESRTVTLSWPADALPSGRPALRVEGYNVPRTVARS